MTTVRQTRGAYDHRAIEARWQERWLAERTFAARDDRRLPKSYVLDFFPYPSGKGLHVGHPLGYIATDIVARYKRHRGFNVLHPMGWDAFGLPAEQHALATGVHPATHDARNVDNLPPPAPRFGFSYDWEREVDTTDPSLLPLDAVDLPQALREGPGLPGRGAGELVPGARHRARQRGGHRRQVEVGGHPVSSGR
jgi:hypothetical protein